MRKEIVLTLDVQLNDLDELIETKNTLKYVNLDLKHTDLTSDSDIPIYFS